jgi:hypothetical protein
MMPVLITKGVSMKHLLIALAITMPIATGALIGATKCMADYATVYKVVTK